jgi:hypothetical protein
MELVYWLNTFPLDVRFLFVYYDYRSFKKDVSQDFFARTDWCEKKLLHVFVFCTHLKVFRRFYDNHEYHH